MKWITYFIATPTEKQYEKVKKILSDRWKRFDCMTGQSDFSFYGSDTHIKMSGNSCSTVAWKKDWKYEDLCGQTSEVIYLTYDQFLDEIPVINGTLFKAVISVLKDDFVKGYDNEFIRKKNGETWFSKNGCGIGITVHHEDRDGVFFDIRVFAREPEECYFKYNNPTYRYATHYIKNFLSKTLDDIQKRFDEYVKTI